MHTAQLIPAKQPRKTYTAYFLLIITTLFWSGNIVIGKAFQNDITPLSLAFLRWLCASLLLLPFSLSHLRKDWPAILAGWRMITLLSLLGISAFNTILYYSAHTTAATNIALIQTSLPLFVVILSYVLFSQAITRGMLAGVGLGISGAALVIFKGDLLTLQSLRFSPGDISMLCAVFIYALYSVLLPKAPALHPLSFLAVTFILGTILLVPLYAWERLDLPATAFDLRLVEVILYTAVCPSILAYLFWNHGVATVGSATTGLFACFIPVFTAVIASLFLHEALHVYHAIGMVMIIAGVLTTQATNCRNSAHT